MGRPSRLERALAAIDAANADDPNTLLVRGKSRPKELAHAALASEWLERLAPGASEELTLALRGHHVRRWEIPRSEYQMDRGGYLRWRKALQRHHASVVADILESCDYAPAEIARVQALIQKRGLGTDPETQVFEDALCLVFLETQFRDLVDRLDAEKLPNIILRTIEKMSPRAIALVGELTLRPEEVDLLQRNMPEGTDKLRGEET